jgi:hypothetical protein
MAQKDRSQIGIYGYLCQFRVKNAKFVEIEMEIENLQFNDYEPYFTKFMKFN